MAYITSLCRTTSCFLSGPSSRSSEMSHATSNARPTRSWRVCWGHSDAIIAFSPMRAGGFAILGKRECYGHGVTGKRPRLFEHQLPPGLRLRRRGGPGEELGRIRPRTSTTRADRLFPCPAREVGTQRRAGAARSDFAYPFRVPDVCLVLGEPAEQIFRTPPFICIEILSPDDRLSEMRQRVEDYLAFGVPYVWILDPATRHAWRCTPGGMQEVTELRTENPETLVPVCDLFE